MRIQTVGVADTYAVSILGRGEELDLIVPWSGGDLRSLATEVLGELGEAAAKPAVFMARRRMAAERATESFFVKERMIVLAEKAMVFARKMKPFIFRALQAHNDDQMSS